MKFKVLHKLASTLFIILSIFASTLAFAADISQEQLTNRLKSDNNVVLLDVRSESEFNDGHIESAVNIPHSELAERLSELTKSKNNQIVIYCRSGRRAEVARQVLAQNGFTHLDHLSGDFNAWTANNLPIVKAQTTK